MNDHTIVLHDHDKSPVFAASAIALCEERDRGLRARLKDETIEAFIRDLKIQIAQNSAHLAEFEDWQKRIFDTCYCETCKTLTEEYEMLITTKAKRLLGKIE